MKAKTIPSRLRRLSLLVLVAVLLLGTVLPAGAAQTKDPFRQITTSHDGVSFTYELFLTDRNGMSVHNPRTLAAGDPLYVEIRLTRDKFTESSYDSFGIEFRLLTRGLSYNNDGTTLRNGTQVRKTTYLDGDSVGFAWYDMAQVGEAFPNPVLAASWSYTVEDPSAVNITVPVALIYLTGDDRDHIPVGKAWLFLDVNGGRLLGADVSGEYTSGTLVTLPDAEFDDYVFDGWSDGVRLYPPGSQYAVSGVVTLTAQWSGLVRDRYLSFLPEGGTFDPLDPSGYYADGEVVIMPEAVREGWRLLGWSDGVTLYAPGESYTVSNSVNFTALWEPVEEDKSDDSGMGIGGCCCWWWLLGLLLILLLLFKRRWVKYSLVNGDISLNVRDKKHNLRVAVVLYDDEDKEYHLNKSDVVPAGQRLRFIKNMPPKPIAPIETGRYKGKLVLVDGTYVKVKKCRIKVLDRKLREKKNK